jgi:hypothetical protein
MGNDHNDHFDYARSLGNIEADLRGLTTKVNEYFEAITGKQTTQEDRIRSLENRQSWQLGVAAAIGTLVGLIPIILSLLNNKGTH